MFPCLCVHRSFWQLKAGASAASTVCSFSGHNGPVRSVAISARKCKGIFDKLHYPPALYYIPACLLCYPGVSGKVAQSSSSSSISSSSASRAKNSATDHAGERLVLTASADRTVRLWIPGLFHVPNKFSVEYLLTAVVYCVLMKVEPIHYWYYRARKGTHRLLRHRRARSRQS